MHAAESKVFSTKDRCPYLACVEVLLDSDSEDCADSATRTGSQPSARSASFDCEESTAARGARRVRKLLDGSVEQPSSPPLHTELVRQQQVMDDEPLGQWRSDVLDARGEPPSHISASVTKRNSDSMTHSPSSCVQSPRHLSRPLSKTNPGPCSTPSSASAVAQTRRRSQHTFYGAPYFETL